MRPSVSIVALGRSFLYLGAATFVLVILVTLAGCSAGAAGDDVTLVIGSESDVEGRSAATESRECCEADAVKKRASDLASFTSMPSDPSEPVIPDVPLIDQEGREKRFYSDVLEDRLVLMNAVFTSCTGTCPMQTSIFASTRDLLRRRGDLNVQIVSVSLDPITDTPARLREFATQYGADSDWLFLTGKKTDVDLALESMGLDAPVPEEHTPIAVIGNEATGVWMKVINLTSPVELVEKIELVASVDARQVAGR